MLALLAGGPRRGHVASGGWVWSQPRIWPRMHALLLCLWIEAHEGLGCIRQGQLRAEALGRACLSKEDTANLLQLMAVMEKCRP